MKAIWRRPLFLPALLALSVAAGRLVWVHEHPWAKYGVTITEDHGDSDTLLFFQFHLTRDGKEIEGPRIQGDILTVTYRPRADSSVPDAVVRSDVYHNCYVIVRLNLSDPSKPEFEIPDKTCLSIWYPPLGYESE